jgi:hypothetical protein
MLFVDLFMKIVDCLMFLEKSRTCDSLIVIFFFKNHNRHYFDSEILQELESPVIFKSNTIVPG